MNTTFPGFSDSAFLFLHGLAGEPCDFVGVAANMPACRIAAPRIAYLTTSRRSLEELAAEILNDLPGDWPLDRTVVVGNSLGGAVALAMAEHVPSLVLAATHIQLGRGFLSRTGLTVRKELDRIFYDPTVIADERIAHYETRWQELASSRQGFGMLRCLKRMVTAFDFGYWYARYQHKITLVCGHHDRISPLGDFRALAARHPRMRMLVLDRCGHAIPLERPAALADVLISQARSLSFRGEAALDGHKPGLTEARPCHLSNI